MLEISAFGARKARTKKALKWSLSDSTFPYRTILQDSGCLLYHQSLDKEAVTDRYHRIVLNSDPANHCPVAADESRNESLDQIEASG